MTCVGVAGKTTRQVYYMGGIPEGLLYIQLTCSRMRKLHGELREREKNREIEREKERKIEMERERERERGEIQRAEKDRGRENRKIY